MKQIIVTAVLAAVAGALASCELKPIVVEDTRALTGVVLRVNDENSSWEAGETRYFTVGFEPSSAVVKAIRLEQNIEGMVEISQGERPDLFKVLARKAGRVKLTATVTDQNDIVKSAELSFNITGSYQPKMVVRLKRSAWSEEYEAFPKVMVCESGDELRVETLSDNGNVVFGLASSEPGVLAVEESPEAFWILKALAPGKADLTVTMVDKFGSKRQKSYEVYVYGHVAFETYLVVSDLTLGLSAQASEGVRVGCKMDVDGTAYGWPEGYPNYRKSVMLNSLKDYVEVFDGFDYPDMLDVQYPIEELCSLAPYQGCYYDVHGLVVQFTLEMKSPYVRIDGIGTLPVEGKDISIKADFVQNGLEEHEEVPDDAAEELEESGISVDGWDSGVDVVIPL